ncbi:alpha/beta hydrolase [Thalassotalea ponticola]|uniref:alpha/beta fold hydrolase n=1 Tax=Thalassotalea ponticola TaxID=1523392 RepID=UPI0025B51AC1|nr:alpha/beta hydrolase [Thalassotalea ponticola]MDN3652354.1 alpha/beta hydrolase [Thalassotalea ponticola]
MKLKLLPLTALTLTLSLLPQVHATPYKNETPITFKAHSGETTDAYEGHFFVPENRAKPNSRLIRVDYVRFPALNEAKGYPTVYLSGGPGGSGIGTAQARRYPMFQAMREFGDVIALDQRGTGRSQRAPRCESNYRVPLDKVVSQQQIVESYRNAAEQCFANWQEQGWDIHGYTTEQNALDLESLRQHLNAKKVNLWGISYGSHLAMAAMRNIPDALNKVIIASAEGLDQTVKLPAQTNQYFQSVQSIIDQQPLGKDVTDLPQLMRSVHEKLLKQPIALSVTTQQGGELSILFQPHHIQMLASMMIADPNQYVAMLVQMYRELDQGKTTVIEYILQQGVFNNQPIGFDLMPLAMDVASGMSPARATQVDEQLKSALLGQWLNFPMPALNRIDTDLDLGDDFRAPLTSNVPTLLFTGTLDGRTYPQEQTEAVAGLSQLTQITVKHAGHNLYMSSPEVFERMRAFMLDKPVDQTAIELPLPDLAFKPQ